MKRFTAVRLLMAVAAAVTLSGCATKGDIRSLQTEMAREIQTIAARQDSLVMVIRRETMSTQDTLRTQSNQLFDFRGDITSELRSISQALGRLEAIVGQNQQAISRLGTGGGVTAQRAPSDTTGFTLSDAESLGGVESSEEQLYTSARDLDQRGSLNTALLAYRDLLDQYPNGARAPSAQFYVADILARQGNTEDALEAFQAVSTLHPRAERVPEALYRAATLQLELGDEDEARATAQRIVNTYPGTPYAGLAQDLLDDLE